MQRKHEQKQTVLSELLQHITSMHVEHNQRTKCCTVLLGELTTDQRYNLVDLPVVQLMEIAQFL